MSSFKIRPRFRQQFESSPKEMEGLIRDRIEHDNEQHKIDAVFSGHHIILKIPTSEQHYWSPQLSLSLEDENEGTLVRGMYGPPPSVWTMFAFGYFALAVAFVVTGIAAYSYHLLDISTKLVWLLPAYLVAALILYMVAQFGQKLGAEQTYTLHHFYEETVGKRTYIE
ncbi:MAG: hypothetical protein JXR19_02595 [Bacteroidia bacterium]